MRARPVRHLPISPEFKRTRLLEFTLLLCHNCAIYNPDVLASRRGSVMGLAAPLQALMQGAASASTPHPHPVSDSEREPQGAVVAFVAEGGFFQHLTIKRVNEGIALGIHGDHLSLDALTQNRVAAIAVGADHAAI